MSHKEGWSDLFLKNSHECDRLCLSELIFVHQLVSSDCYFGIVCCSGMNPIAKKKHDTALIEQRRRTENPIPSFTCRISCLRRESDTLSVPWRENRHLTLSTWKLPSKWGWSMKRSNVDGWIFTRLSRPFTDRESPLRKAFSPNRSGLFRPKVFSFTVGTVYRMVSTLCCWLLERSRTHQPCAVGLRWRQFSSGSNKTIFFSWW